MTVTDPFDELIKVVAKLRAQGWDDDEILQHREYRAALEATYEPSPYYFMGEGSNGHS